MSKAQRDNAKRLQRNPVKCQGVIGETSTAKLANKNWKSKEYRDKLCMKHRVGIF